VIRKRLVVLGVVMCGALCLSVAGAPLASAGTACVGDTWYGPGGSASLATSGNWLTASNWSTGVLPGNSDVACITVPGTYTVTVQPTDIGTDDPDNYGASVGSLVLGGTTGAQKVEVSGQSSDNNGDIVNLTYLAVENPSTINPTGTLVLDSTGTGPGSPAGGAAQIGGTGTWLNSGVINVQSEDPNEFIDGPPSIGATAGGPFGLTNEPSGSLNFISGPATVALANLGVGTNDGSITIDPAATVTVGGDSGDPDNFTNDGSIADNGSLTIGGTTWNQTGGSISGNTVVIGNNATLADAQGAAQFLVTSATVGLTGTVPAGQTITVQPGLPLDLNGDQLVNDGTVVLQGNTISNGNGPTAVFNGSIENSGALDLTVTDPSYVNELDASVTNSHSGTVTVAGVVGQSEGVNGITFTNDGTVTLAPTTLWNMYGGATFTDEADGTLVPQIASASSFGTISVGGTMTAAGTIAPALTGGYTPPSGQEFDVLVTGNGSFHGTYTGTFATVGSGFTVDYTNAPANPGYVGVVYGGSSAPAPTVDPTSTSVSCSPSSVLAGGASTCTATVTDSATSGASTPTGAVTFTSAPTTGAFGSSGSCTLAATGTTGKASCQLTFSPAAAGSYTITGSYGADTNHHTSSGTSSLTATTSGGGGGGTPGPGTITIGSAVKVASDGRAGVTLNCAGAKGATCAGTLKLTVRVRTRVTRKVRGHRRTVTKLTTVQIGSAAYRLPAGQSETLGVKLSAAGMRLLDASGNGRLSAKASATASTGGSVSRAVTLIGPPRRRTTKK
jgi:collagen type VII alpha